MKLIIFDVDRTLTPDMTGERFDPDVVAKLVSLRNSGVALALASNQGGVGLRHWIESAGGFGATPEAKAQSLLDAQKYPTVESAMRRLSAIAGNVTALTLLPCRIYACFAYQSKAGNVAPVPSGQEADPMWSLTWRKPNPGMLIQAMHDAGVLAADTLFVGDSEEDRQAAEAAGVKFAEAKEFFNGENK